MFELFEILMSGVDRYAGEPLSDLETARVREALEPGERLLHFARGRLVGSGVGLWVLTDQRLLALDLRERLASRVELDGTAALRTERGQYGVTMTLDTRFARLALFAADRGLAVSFAEALVAHSPAVAWHDATRPLLSAERSECARVLAESMSRVQPTLPLGSVQTVVLLRDLAALHDRGLLNESEFAAFKQRLLDAA